MKVLVVAGARPNFMKVAPIIAELSRRGHKPVLVHTGQHYDAEMSDAFFRDLGIPDPDYHLGVGSGSHAQQTARVMEAFEPVLLETRPSWVVVVGDVNSTLAAALVASKLKEQTGARVAHVEAGLRSNDWRMPEEVNRVLTDRLSDLLLTPSPDAQTNLTAEGIPQDRIIFVGNVMIDTLEAQLPAARALEVPARFGLQRDGYALVTLHRPSNVDEAEALATILDALDQLAAELPVIVPVHPRTRQRIRDHGLSFRVKRIRLIDPLGYRDMLGLTEAARLVITDSGGLQEETTALGVPCVTMREQTERPITIEEGTNRLVPWPIEVDSAVRTFREAMKSTSAAVRRPRGWDGNTAQRIVDELERRVSESANSTEYLYAAGQ